MNELSTKKVVYIVSQVHKSLAFEWIAEGLKKKYDLTFILLNAQGSPLEDFLLAKGVEVRRINYRGKIDFLTAFIKILLFFIKSKPEVVHAHLLDAQLIGLVAAKLVGIKNRIYTRHNSNFHHVYHQKGILFDKISNGLATKIVSVSYATDITLTQLEKVNTSKIVKIPHGFDMKIFEQVPSERRVAIIKKWSITDNKPIVGVIARHIEWKGIQYIIPAFKKFLNEYPSATLILVNATGPYHKIILELLNSIPRDRFILIPFEVDIAALYSVFDLYVHTPIDTVCEAFGQTYIEALAAGVPSIFTLSGIANEFIEHEKNALIVPFKNSDEIYQALLRLWTDISLREKLISNGRHDVISKFELSSMLAALNKLYE
ncbi:MAG: glycosyltransferase family 4 protein [Bacteroidetes bacterium]|nr:glycosyltransferase family 4 protein [Bacteroidota bacterium]